MNLKHLEIDKNSIHYIGKESNELDNSEVLGVSKDDTVEYVDEQKKLRMIIENLTLEKALEIGISRREFYYLKNKGSIRISKKIFRTLWRIIT